MAEALKSVGWSLPTWLRRSLSLVRFVPSVLLHLLSQVATVSTLDSRMHSRLADLGPSTEDRLTGYLEDDPGGRVQHSRVQK